MDINLNRDIIIDIDLNNGKIEKPYNASYYNTDSNIAFFYVKLHKMNAFDFTEYISKEDAGNYKVAMKIVKPKTLITTELIGTISDDLDEDCAIYKFIIKDELMNEVGEPFCYISIYYNNQELVTNGFNFTIKQDPLGRYNLVLLNDPDMPLLKSLLEEIKNNVGGIDDENVRDDKSFSSYKTTQIANNLSSQIKEKATKQEVDVERKRIDSFTSLTSGSTTGDAELIDGRTVNGVTYNNIGGAIRAVSNGKAVVDKAIVGEKLDYSRVILSDEIVNLLNPNTVTYGKYIDDSGVMKTTTDNKVYCTDFIDVFGNKPYCFYKLLNVRGVWYDENKNFISILAYDSAGSRVITAPSNAKYVRWNGDSTVPPDTTMIVYGGEYPSSYIPYSDYKKSYEIDWLRINEKNLENINIETKIDLSDKTWYSFGDSITWQDGKAYASGLQQGQIAKGYQTLIKEETKINYTNKGVSGDTLEGMYNQLTASDLNFDIASFAIGTNDFMFNHDLTRYTNNLNTVCTYIAENLQDKQVFFIAPLQRWGYINNGVETTMTNDKGITLLEYVDKMKEVCGNYGIPVIDLYRNSQLNKLNINTFTRDGLHPIDAGYEKYYRLIEKQIINMLT